MKVKEAIEALSRFNPNANICVEIVEGIGTAIERNPIVIDAIDQQTPSENCPVMVITSFDLTWAHPLPIVK